MAAAALFPAKVRATGIDHKRQPGLPVFHRFIAPIHGGIHRSSAISIPHDGGWRWQSRIRKRRISRRLLIGGAAVVAGLGWAGTTLARLGRDPSGRKDLGRIADVDGIALPLEAAGQSACI